jgi:hypothetical protein
MNLSNRGGSADKIGARLLLLEKIKIFDNGAELLLSLRVIRRLPVVWPCGAL